MRLTFILLVGTLISNIVVFVAQKTHTWSSRSQCANGPICMHTYIIGHYNPSVGVINLVFHTTYVVCVNFIYKWRALQFKDDCERQIFWETFHGNFYLLSGFLPEICWEEIAEEILFVFCFDVMPGARTLAIRIISQTPYLTSLDHISLKMRTPQRLRSMETPVAPW